MILQANFGAKGFIRHHIWNQKTGKTRVDTGFVPNTVLIQGLNRMGEFSDWFNASQVGTDSTLPNSLQTGMQAYKAGSSIFPFYARGAQSTAPYYGYYQKTFRYNAGVATGNLNEAGAGWSTTGSTLWNRALTVDLFGVANTVTLLVDEILDLTIQIRYYPPLVDVTGVITIQGIDYNYILRAAEVTTGTAWGTPIGSAVGERVSISGDWAAYDGDIASITGTPSGVSAGIDVTSAVVNAPYSNNSFYRDISFNVGPGGWNPSSGLGIRSVLFRTTAGSYQIQFNAVSGGGRIPKNGGRTINGLFRLAWADAGVAFSSTIPAQAWSVGVPVSLDIATYFSNPTHSPVYTVIDGSLPSGVSINASTGLISGTPVGVATGTFQIECENAIGGPATSNSVAWTVS